MLGRDYSYPCTIAIAGACTWLHIWKNKSTQAAPTPTPAQPSFEQQVRDHVDGIIDASAGEAKQNLNSGIDAVVNTGVVAAKATVITTLPCVGTFVAPSLDPLGASAKSASQYAAGKSVDTTAGTVKKCVASSFNKSKDGTSSASTSSWFSSR